VQTWPAFAAREPDLSTAGRALLYQMGVGLGFLATTRPDGAPRLHPMCPLLHEAGLFAFIIPSPKQRDLRRDGRYALHSFPCEDNEDAFSCSGVARAVEDTGLRSELSALFVAERMQLAVPAPAEEDVLFEFLLGLCLLTRTTGHGDANPVHRVWRDERRDVIGREPTMGQGISAVLTFAIGVAISPVPIIAVILMLFSQRARVNGTAFLVGWVVALAAVSTIVYVVSHDGNVAQTSSTASESVSWGTIALGVGMLALARRNWRKRPAPGTEPVMPKWLASVESVSPMKALGLGVALAAVNPKNLILTAGAAAGLAQVSGLTTTDAVVAIAVFVVIASLTIAGPVIYSLVGGAKARASLDSAKTWLTAHNAAVMAVLFLVFGVDLIAKGLPPLTG
jgi:hypothetical protein